MCSIHPFLPTRTRSNIFEPRKTSSLGAPAVKSPAGVSRKSFAAYYYTREAPAQWSGKSHSTMFKARPGEKLKGALLMPAEKAVRWTWRILHEAKRTLRGG